MQVESKCLAGRQLSGNCFGSTLLHFTSAACFCRRLAITDLHDLDDGFPVLDSCQIAVDMLREWSDII